MFLPPGFNLPTDTVDLVLMAVFLVCAVLLVWMAVSAIIRNRAAIAAAPGKVWSLDVNNEKLRWSLTLPNVFVWNVQANAAKGTAGGSVKLTFRPGTALLVSLGFLILAIVARPITQFVIPSIFLFFVFYYLRSALSGMGSRINRTQGADQ